MSDSPELLVLEQFLPFQLNRISESVSQNFAQHYRREYGMTRPEWRTLAVLGQYGVLTSTQICHYSTMHKTKVSRAVQSLANRGWLVRERDASDRRLEYLHLTTKGRRNYGKLVKLAREFEKELQNALTPSAYAKVQEALHLLEALELHRTP